MKIKLVLELGDETAVVTAALEQQMTSLLETEKITGYRNGLYNVAEKVLDDLNSQVDSYSPID